MVCMGWQTLKRLEIWTDWKANPLGNILGLHLWRRHRFWGPRQEVVNGIERNKTRFVHSTRKWRCRILRSDIFTNSHIVKVLMSERIGTRFVCSTRKWLGNGWWRFVRHFTSCPHSKISRYSFSYKVAVFLCFYW